jgi:hypothetical protein
MSLISYISYQQSIAYIRKTDMGRKKLWPERILLPLTTETLEKIDASLDDGEARVDLIRQAIERELKRRARRSS